MGRSGKLFAGVLVKKDCSVGLSAAMRGRRFWAVALFVASAAILFFGQNAFGQESFDCPTMCEQETKQALEKCRKSHAKNPAECPSDNGRIPDECRRVCAEFSGKSVEELQNLLPPNYKDIIEGK
jgi:hypothetical protein